MRNSVRTTVRMAVLAASTAATLAAAAVPAGASTGAEPPCTGESAILVGGATTVRCTGGLMFSFHCGERCDPVVSTWGTVYGLCEEHAPAVC